MILSRVQELNQLYIIDTLAENKIRPSENAMKEVERMNKISLNQNLPVWYDSDSSKLKVALLNAWSGGIPKHFVDIEADETLLKSSVICITETWLQEQHNLSAYQLPGYTAHFNNSGRGKGLAIFFKENFKLQNAISNEAFQISKVSSLEPEADVICLYRSENGNQSLIVDHLKSIINKDKATLVLGDFNLCYQEDRQNLITSALENELNFTQYIRNGTHIAGRIIDHVYVSHREPFIEPPAILQRSIYYSDHDNILTTLGLENCVFETSNISHSADVEEKPQKPARLNTAEKQGQRKKLTTPCVDIAQPSTLSAKRKKLGQEPNTARKRVRRNSPPEQNQCIPCSTCSTKCQTCHLPVCDICSPDAEEMLSKRHCLKCFNKMNH